MDKKFNNLNKFIIFISLLIFVWLVLDLFVFGGQQLGKQTEVENSQEVVVEDTNTDIFYWGDGCPHCETVKAWMSENNIEEKIEIISKEVYKNQANSVELTARAKSCGLDTQRIGVPFLYTIDGQCIVGSPNIIEYLEANISR